MGGNQLRTDIHDGGRVFDPSRSRTCVFTVALQLTVDVNPVIVINPGGPRSAIGTPFSVTDIVSMETEELLRSIEAGGGFGRKQEALKTLVRRKVIRDDR